MCINSGNFDFEDGNRNYDDEIQVTDTTTTVGELSGNTSKDILRPNLRRSKVGGRAPKRSPKHKNKKAKKDHSSNDESWEQFADTPIKDLNDNDLAEYLIGTSTSLTVNEDYWPGDKGAWKAECVCHRRHTEDNF